MNNEDLQKQIDDLKKQLALLSQKRIFQQDIAPAALKIRHFGEGNPWIYAGTSAKRPTSGNVIKAQGYIFSCNIYFETDTGKLKIWNGTAWVSVTLS